jgi:hypothetical protein
MGSHYCRYPTPKTHVPARSVRLIPRSCHATPSRLLRKEETLVIDVLWPGHEPRKTTALFTGTRKQLIEREGGRCLVSNMTAEELGAPLEAHPHPIVYVEFDESTRGSLEVEKGANGMKVSASVHHSL